MAPAGVPQLMMSAELPPLGAVAEIGDEEVGGGEREEHRHARRDPHELGERMLEVHLVGVLVLRRRERLVHQVAETPEAMIMKTRILKIHTSSLTCRSALDSGMASRMNVMSATPVTP